MEKFIQFTDELRCGVGELDNLHEVLADVLSELHAAIKLRQGDEAVQELLQKVEDHARICFAVEESLMRILGYPGYEAHEAQHKVLLARLPKLRDREFAGNQSASSELIDFLRSWLINHILVSDKDCSSFFLACGVQPQRKRKPWAVFGTG
jgi:hemerythrin